jgi:hypothetical protein
MLSLLLPVMLVACEPEKDRDYPIFEETGDTTDDTGDGTGDTSDTGDGTGDTSDTGDGTGDTSDTGDETSDLVRIGYSGFVANVVGAPFGLDNSAEGTVFSGYLAFDPGTADEEPGDEDRGVYDHRDDSATFTVSLTSFGHTITGSGNPFVVVDAATATFTGSDGRQPGDVAVDRVCSIDGAEDPEIAADISFVSTTDDDLLATDALTDDFPFLSEAFSDYTVSFVIEQGANTLLLDVISITLVE